MGYDVSVIVSGVGVNCLNYWERLSRSPNQWSHRLFSTIALKYEFHAKFSVENEVGSVGRHSLDGKEARREIDRLLRVVDDPSHRQRQLDFMLRIWRLAISYFLFAACVVFGKRRCIARADSLHRNGLHYRRFRNRLLSNERCIGYRQEVHRRG